MTSWILAFLIGIVCGLRAFTGVAAASWAARLRWIGVGETKLAFLGFTYTPYIFSLLALVEFVTDQLPKTPSRKVPQQFVPRIVSGALSGAAMCIGTGSVWAGILAGIAGSVVGTLGGAKARQSLALAFGKDMPAAFLEDAVAIGVALFVVTHSAL